MHAHLSVGFPVSNLSALALSALCYWIGFQHFLGPVAVGFQFVSVLLLEEFHIAVFGLVHAPQGWRNVAVIAGMAAAAHLLVYLSGSLYVAMVVHCGYDLGAGVIYVQLIRRGELKLTPKPA